VDTDVKEILESLRKIGPKVVIVTDGPEGTYSYDGQKYLHMPIVPATVVERTGAGDAFGSGFLAGYISGKSVEECLRWGTVNSASVLGFVGPQAGLLTPDKLQEWLERTMEVKMEEI
jgi:sugar/nucleoside kinase (ribokinase family)